MLKGLLSGVFWGVVVVGIGLVGVSLFAPLPGSTVSGAPQVEPAAVTSAQDAGAVPAAVTPDAAPTALPVDTPSEGVVAPETAAPNKDTEVPLPAGSQFNQPPVDAEPTLPTTDAAPVTTDATAPSVVPEAVAPQPDTQTASLPQAVATAPSVAAPVAEGALPSVSGTIDPEAPPASFQPEPLGGEAVEPVAEEDTAADPAETPAAQTAPLTTDATPAEDAGAVAEPEAPAVALDTPAPVAPEEAPAVTALVAPTVQENPLAPAATASPLAPRVVPTGPALTAHAEPFANPEGKPVFSIILIDTADTRLDRATLRGFSFPVAFAIDPSREDATEAAAAYRDAGFEVVMLADSLPRVGPVQDLAVALEGAMNAVPEAVAMMDSRSSFLQRTRTALEPVLENLLISGHGFLSYPEGLNTAEATARRLGVPAQTVYRLLDAENERSTVITRYLDRATFIAGQEGHVVVVGHTYADTVTALYSWQQSNRARTIEVAPISHVLLEKGR